MIPLECLPGYRQWSTRLGLLRTHPGPVWIHGEPGSGVSTFAAGLAEERGGEVLDDAEERDPAAVAAWLKTRPAGVIASHAGPEISRHAAVAGACLAFRLPTFEDDPGAAAACLRTLAEAAGAPDPPPALAALPCPGNLRGLQNRLLRWTLLGQLPESQPRAEGLPLETEDLATNLHELERVLLHRALRRSYGNRVEAAVRLGVSRRQIYLLVARHGDPVRGEVPVDEGPKRLRKRKAQA
jgi:hypothetical protein